MAKINFLYGEKKKLSSTLKCHHFHFYFFQGLNHKPCMYNTLSLPTELSSIDIQNVILLFFCFRTGFRPTNGGRLIWLMRRGMRTGQVLFPLGIEIGIPQIRP